MEITLGSLEISASADKVFIRSQRIRANSSMIRPLRASSARPKPRGGAVISWTIEVFKLHANLTAAEAYRAGVAASVASAMEHDDTAGPLVIPSRGTYVDAVIDDVDVQDRHLTSIVVWQITSSTASPPPP